MCYFTFEKFNFNATSKLLVNAHVLSNFFYCLLIWMFCRKADMARIDKIHKRALRTIYNNFDLSLEELLLLDKSCTIHQKHLQFLMIEVFKSINYGSPGGSILLPFKSSSIFLIDI